MPQNKPLRTGYDSNQAIVLELHNVARDRAMTIALFEATHLPLENVPPRIGLWFAIIGNPQAMVDQ
jgi:hypothetical protein